MKWRLIGLLIITSLLSSCGSSPEKDNVTGELSSPTSQTISEPTAIVEPSPTPTLPPTQTAAPEPTSTDTPTAAPTPTATPACTNKAELVRHLSFAGTSKITPDTYFNKAWLIKNSGTCVWGPGYQVVFSNGESMNSPSEVQLPKEVLPGETLNLQILLRSPIQPTTYSGAWLLRDPNGQIFGVGDNSDQPLSVTILVQIEQPNKRVQASECG